MASEDTQSQSAEIFENFCFMVAEDFLRRKGLENTLSTFRKEYERPKEETVVSSWYEVALKLRLPELISQNSKSKSILENLVHALIRESSVRCRQSPDVLVTGLGTLPRPTSLPAIVDHSRTNTPAGNIATGESAAQPAREIKQGVVDKTGHKKISTANVNGGSAPFIKSKLPDSPDKFRELVLRAKQSGGPQQHASSENWIPEETRFRSMLRDLSVAKETYTAIRKREVGYEKEVKRLQVTDLDRARTEESLAATHKTPCGCCTQMFLYVNLPLKVSRKAILDIRRKWSGMLSSATVFGAIPSSGEEEDDATSSIALGGANTSTYSKGTRKGGIKGSKKSKGEDPNDLFTGGNLGQVPRCYDQVGVCAFCAQFFIDLQEDYRPSFEAITKQERRAAYIEAKQREQEYWDPLKMIEKDRERQQAAAAAAATAAGMDASTHGQQQLLLQDTGQSQGRVPPDTEDDPDGVAEAVT